jgi:hypothetical protein
MQRCLLYGIVDWQDKCDEISIRVRGKEVLTIGERLASLIEEAHFKFAKARHETSLSASGLLECPLLALSEVEWLLRVAFASGPVARHNLVLVRLFCEFARSMDAQSDLIGIPDHKTQKEMSIEDATSQEQGVQSCYSSSFL